MATLYFKVSSDWEQVVRLRQECERLEAQLKSMNTHSDPEAVRRLETQLATARGQMRGMVSEAAEAASQLQSGFRQRIYEASQTVNDFSERIIAQRSAVKGMERDFRELREAYRAAVKAGSPDEADLLEALTAKRRAVDDEKAALFDLTLQQAEARLSVKRLRDEYALYKDDAEDTRRTNEGLSLSLTKVLAVIGGASALKSLASDIIRVRSEFQAADTAIETLLGDKERADALMAEVRKYAAISPLEFSDVTQVTQMMLGFNIEAEKVPRYLQAIGDVSMGDAQKFSSIALAFSQISAAGKLMGQDLNQLINAGFNPLQVIAERTGRSIAELKEEMSKGAISAEMVQQAFIDATSEGGKFYHMSENGAKTISGQLSMMQDALDAVFNELGQKGEGVLMSGIRLTTSMIENYERLGRILVGLVAAYGTYRAGVLLATAAENGQSAATLLLRTRTLLAEKAQALLNKTMLSNPYVLVASLIAGVVVALMSMKTETERLEEAQEAYEERLRKTIEAEEEHIRKVKELCDVAADESLATDTRREALDRLEQQYPKIFAKYDTELEKLRNIKRIKEEIAAFEQERSAANPKNELKDVEKRIADLTKLSQTVVEVRDQFDAMTQTWTTKKQKRGLTPQERAEFKTLTARRDALNAQSRRDAVHDYFGRENLKQFDDGKLERLIRQRENLRAKMKVEGKRAGRLISGDETAQGTFSDDELQYQLNQLREEQARRKEKRTSASEWGAEARRKYEAALKAYNDFISSTTNRLTEQEYDEQAKKLKEAVDEARKEADKYKTSASSKTPARDDESDRRLKERRHADELLLALQRQNQQADLALMEEGKAKKLRQIDETYDAQEKEIAKRARELAEANRKAGITGLNADGLTQEQQTEVDRAHSLNGRTRDKALADVGQAEAASLQEYLRQYGDYQQQREAIAREYAGRIAQAETEGERLSLEQQQKKALEDVDLGELKDGLDWEAVFGDLDRTGTETLTRLRDRLKEFIATQKDLSPESLKELMDAVRGIDRELESRSPFRTMGEDLKALVDASTEAREAQEAYNRAVREGTKEEQAEARATLDAARSKKRKAQAKATSSLHAGVSQAKEYLGAANDVMGIMDTVGVKPPEWLKGYLDGTGKVLDGLSTMDLTKPATLITGGIKSLSGMVEQVSSVFGAGDSDPTLERDIERLTASNQALKNALEALSEQMQRAAVADASSIHEKQRENIRQSERNTWEMMVRSAAAHGGSHSSGYRIDKGMTDAEWEEISRITGVRVRRSADFWQLTSEQMWRVSTEATAVYAHIKDLADDGYRDAAQFMDTYIGYWQQLEQLDVAWKQKLTSASFDGIRSEFRSALTDMEGDAANFAKQFEQLMQNAMLEDMMTRTYDNRLKEWYNDFAARMDSGGLDTGEQDELRRRWRSIVDDARSEWETKRDLMGWNASDAREQQSTSRGFGTEMTHEDAGELSGRFTAVAESNYRIEGAITRLEGNVGVLTTGLTGLSGIADETRDILARSYLELQEIRANTGEIIRPIKQMQLDIADVKRNTDRL